MFSPAELGIHIIYTLFWCAVVLWAVITPFWILTMKKALETVAPQFRKMHPPMVWLAMVPLVGCFWQFMVSSAVANSFREEYAARGIITKEPRPGASLGLTADIFFCTILIPVYGLLFTLISFITRLMHLFRIKNYTDHLQGIIDMHAQQMAQPQQPDFNWLEYQMKAEEATKMIENQDPDRFKPVDDGNKENGEPDYDRWRKK